MLKITLGQLLQYYDADEEPAERIQIVTGSQDWDCADEIAVNSDLLASFANWVITDMRCETDHDGKPIIRVAIDRSQQVKFQLFAIA